MTKAELRRIYLEKRLSLSKHEYAQLNVSICNHFFGQIELVGVKVIHTFLPFEKNKEPDTWLIINEMMKRHPDIKFSVPKMNSQTLGLENFFLEGERQLTSNSWGIEEPQYGVVTDPATIDLAIVPLLVCDRQGHRIGYGKGYYDRFLATCSPDCKRVGISFFEPIAKITDINDFDIPLHHCVTPLMVHNFTPKAPADSGSGRILNPK